jgi:branched-chain amino acid transport system substrate-binding protein
VRLPAAALLIADKLPPTTRKSRSSPPMQGLQAKWKTDVSTFGGHAYDGLMLAVDAIKRAGGTDKAKVRDAIEATKGLRRHRRHRQHVGHRPHGPRPLAFRMLEIKGGDWTHRPVR